MNIILSGNDTPTTASDEVSVNQRKAKGRNLPFAPRGGELDPPQNKKTFSLSDLLSLSGLNHFVYCKRRCALVHIEQQWVENRFTAEGRTQHERVDRQEHKMQDGVRIEYAVPLRSLSLGLIGKADAVEFHQKSETSSLNSHGLVFPVEHKRGRPKPSHCDWVQLCAQALCLEEMLNTVIPEGAIFYGLPRRRQVVCFDFALREETKQTAQSFHALIKSGKTPPAEYNSKKCGPCSLLEICMPKKHRAVSRYLQECLE